MYRLNSSVNEHFFLSQIIRDNSFDRNLYIQFCVALSNAYIDLNRNPERARKILEDLLAELKGKNVEPHHAAKINLGLGKVYRYVACLTRKNVISGIFRQQQIHVAW